MSSDTNMFRKSTRLGVLFILNFAVENLIGRRMFSEERIIPVWEANTSNYSVVFADPVSFGLPDLGDVPEAASCKDKCGQIQHFPCTCDQKCIVYRNCCEDFFSVCPLTLEEASHKFGHLLNLEIECSGLAETLLISSCRNQSELEIKQAVHDLEFEQRYYDVTRVSLLDPYIQSVVYLPVTDISTGLVYKNMKIFLCNADNQSTPIRWELAFRENRYRLNFYASNKYVANLLTDNIFFSGHRLLTKQNLDYQCEKYFTTDLVPLLTSNFTNNAILIPFASYFKCVIRRNKKWNEDYLFLNRYQLAMVNARLKLEICHPYVKDDTRSQHSLQQYTHIEFYHEKIVLRFSGLNPKACLPWESLSCNLGDENNSYLLNCNVTCNIGDGYVDRSGSCKRLFYFYIGFSSEDVLKELEKYVSVPGLLHRVLKQRFNLDIRDEWWPPVGVMLLDISTKLNLWQFLVYEESERNFGELLISIHLTSMAIIQGEYKRISNKIKGQSACLRSPNVKLMELYNNMTVSLSLKTRLSGAKRDNPIVCYSWSSANQNQSDAEFSCQFPRVSFDEPGVWECSLHSSYICSDTENRLYYIIKQRRVTQLLIPKIYVYFF